MTEAAISPAAARSTARSTALRTLIACCVAVCVGQAATALPSTLNGLLQAAFQPTGSQLTWVSDASLLPIAVLELTFGAFGDLFGRRRLLTGGAALVAAGEIITAAAGGIPLLWTGQALVGVGAAAIFPSSLAMVAASAPDARRRATAITAWAACLAAGGFVAPLVGGLVGTYASWRWAVITIALIAVVSTSANLTATDSRSPQGRSLDPVGQATVAVGLTAALYAIIQGPADGWGSAQVVVAFVVAAVFLAAFVVAELRVTAPILHLRLFANRFFATASAATVLGMFAFLGTVYGLSIWLGPIQHLSARRIAFAFFFTNAPTALLSPVTARLLRGVPPRWLLAAGFVLLAGGDLLLAARPVASTALGPEIPGLLVVGLGFTLAVTSVTAVAIDTVPARLTGMASATTSQLRDIGFTLGPAVIGAIALSRAASSFTHALNASPLPAPLKAAVSGIAAHGGPLAVNSLPPQAPPAAAAPLALHALGSGYALGFVVCAVSALAAALLSGVALRGLAASAASAAESEESEEHAMDPLVPPSVPEFPGPPPGLPAVVVAASVAPSDTDSSILIKPDGPQISAGAAGPTALRDIVYARRERPDGTPLELKLDLLLPASEGAPLVVYLPGGGFVMAVRDQNVLLRAHLVEQGYAVASVEYRTILDGATYVDGVADARAAVRFLRDHARAYAIDADRVALWGDSAGGYLAAMTATTAERDGAGGEVLAVIDRFGPSDLPRVGADFDPETREALRKPGAPLADYVLGGAAGGTLDDAPEAFALADPATHVTPGAPPFLLMHGTDDRIVSPSQTLHLHHALLAHGVPSTRYLLDGAGHGEFAAILGDAPAALPWTTTETAAHMLTFLNHHLNPHSPTARATRK